MSNNRRWTQKRWTNVSIKEVCQWLDENLSNIEIESIDATARFSTSGVFTNRIDWYFTKFSIRYYPNSPGHEYQYVYHAETDGLFTNAADSIKRKARKEIGPNCRPILDLMQGAHYRCGGPKMTYFFFAIWEKNQESW